MHTLFQQRRSGRYYNPDRFVSKADLKELLEAARWAPSCYGEEPWRYIICDKKKNPDSYERLLSCLVDANKKWARHAPLLMLSVACETFSKTRTFNRWAQYDTGAASISLLLQAVDLGLMAHEMGGFDENKVKDLFQLPKDCTPMAIITVGYEAKDPPDKNQPRTRKPLSENFFEGTWGKEI